MRLYPYLKIGTMTNAIERSSCHVAGIIHNIEMIGFYNFTTMRPFHDNGHLN